MQYINSFQVVHPKNYEILNITHFTLQKQHKVVCSKALKSKWEHVATVATIV